MAAGMLSKPGTEYGPCVEECAHRDCAATRAAAASDCTICAGQIGYAVRVYIVDDRRFAHALCVELEMEAS